jgi:hypothetical protein
VRAAATERYVLYQRCGSCQVEHICPLACCGLDAPQNMQWLTAEANRAKWIRPYGRLNAAG